MSRVKKSMGIAGGVAALGCVLVGGFEGLKLVVYRDIVGVPTACYGETRGIRIGQKFSKPECDAMLMKGLDQFGDGIERCVPSLKTAPAQRYVAHLSLAYNVGVSAYCKSSVARLQNAGHDLAACDGFLKWNRAGGMEVRGLTRRRAQERDWCRSGD